MDLTVDANSTFDTSKVYPVPIAINSATALFSTAENLFILLLFLQERKKLEISHRFVVSMALADLLEGCIGAPLTAVMAFGLRAQSLTCLSTLTIKITIHMLAVFCIVMICIDRFWAMMTPFNHRYYRTPTLANIMICISWGIPIVLGVIGFMLSNPVDNPDKLCFARARFSKLICDIVAFGINVPAMIIVFIMYLIIYIKLLKVHQYSVAHLMQELQKLINEHSNSTDEEDDSTVAEGIRKKDIKTTVWIFLTVVSFWITWGAIVVATLILIHYKGAVSNVFMRYAVQTIVAINSCVNPFLYVFHIKHIKEASRKLFGKLWYCGKGGAQQLQMSPQSDQGYLTESSTT